MTMPCASRNFWRSIPRCSACTIRFVEGHPQRALAMEQMHGGGGVLSFEVDGTAEDARRLRKPCACSAWRRAWAEWIRWSAMPVLTSHGMISAEHRAEDGRDRPIDPAIGRN